MVLHELYRSICYCMNWYCYCILLDGIVWQWHWPQFSIHWKVRESLSLVGWLLCISGNDFKRYTVLTRSMYNEFTTVCSLFFFCVFFYWHPAVPMCPTDNEALDFRILMIKGEHSKSGEDMWQCCWLLSWGHIPSITLNIGQQKGSAIYSNWSGHKREKKRRLGKSLGKRSIRGQ